MALRPSTRYPTKTNAPDANYPYGSARNVTVPGDGTGYPFEADDIKDDQGFKQALLQYAGISPSDTADTAVASQYFEAVRRTAGYPGIVTYHAFSSDPATLGVRLLPLDGRVVLIADYLDLVANTYVGDVNNGQSWLRGFYKSSDVGGTVRSTSGLYFKIPDCRGYFLRVIDDGLILVDPDGQRPPGVSQPFAMYDHSHDCSESSIPSDIYSTFGGSSGDIFIVNYQAGQGPGLTKVLADDINISDPVNNLSVVETRPVNVAFHLAIWY